MKNLDLKYWIFETVITLSSILMMVLLIQHFLIAPFRVHGQSMCNTLNYNDGNCATGEYEQIMISSFAYQLDTPEREDIVVFDIEENNKKISLIKRVIGLPGDQLEIKNGEVFLKKSGEDQFIKLEENYLNETNSGKTSSHNLNGIITVPEDSYFVMGDNRRVSNDSRMCFQKVPLSQCTSSADELFINSSSLRGKAWFVFWPVQNWRMLND